MTKLFTTAALSLAVLAGAASASVATDTIETYAPNADVSAMSNSDVNALLSIIHSSDTEGEKRAAVQAFLQ